MTSAFYGENFLNLSGTHRYRLTSLVVLCSLSSATCTFAEDQHKTLKAICKSEDITWVDRLYLKFKTGVHKSKNEIQCETETTAKITTYLEDQSYFTTKLRDPYFRNEIENSTSHASNDAFVSTLGNSLDVMPNKFQEIINEQKIAFDVLPGYETRGNDSSE